MPIRDYIGPHNPFGGGGSRGQRFGRGMTEILGKVLGGAAGPMGSMAGGAAGRWLGQHFFPAGSPNALQGSPSPDQIAPVLSQYLGVPDYAHGRTGAAPPPGGASIPAGMNRDPSGGEYSYSYDNPAAVGPPAPSGQGQGGGQAPMGNAPRLPANNISGQSTGGGLGYGWQSADPGMTMAALGSGFVNTGGSVADLGQMFLRRAVK